MRIIELPEILSVLDEKATLFAIEDGFRRYSAGEADVMAIGHLAFDAPPGDCHVKGAHLAGDEVFVVKLATSFYRNAELGLPSSNGFMAVVSAKTGEVQAILHDQGRLTDLRTAMAGAIAANAIMRPGSKVLGIVGSGTQARLQAELIARVLGFGTVLVWARNGDRAAAMANELGAAAVALHELCARADLIVTTTPSSAPILTRDMVRPGTRIVAVGADAPGKQELAVELMARARMVVDSRSQCLDHGDTAAAVRAGALDPDSLIELGELLASPVKFEDDEIVIADLTGVAVQDVQIAKAVWARLSSGETPR
jgi:ornithine cyclodeaminase